MNGKDMLEMMSELDEKVVADAAVTPIRKTREKWKIVLGAVAAALIVGILGYTIYPYVRGKITGKYKQDLKSGTLMASPRYPEMPENPGKTAITRKWYTARRVMRDQGISGILSVLFRFRL